MERTVTISIKPELLKQLDNMRHDIPRSRYIQRLIEKNIESIQSIPAEV
jgi:hypothetical protein